MTAKRVKEKTEKSSIAKAIQNPRIWSFLVRTTLFTIFSSFAFNLANTRFFNENPIFGIQFLAEGIIGLAVGIFGYHTVPILASRTVSWFEKVVTGVVSRIVADFWNQQSKRMAAVRRNKQKQRKKVREKKTKEQFKTAILLDTSVLIDGRIVDMVKAGFVDSELIVPRGVINELHLISDSSDDLKRKKGRRGLDILNSLKKVAKVKIFQAQGSISKDDGVDKELVRLAKKYKGKLMTMDFNLNKVAKTTNIKVLNINELANAVKFSVIPGEKIKVKIVQEGKEKKQGLGYMADGTMIVVEDAKDKVDKRLTVTVSKVIQTDAGKMVFCKL